MKQLVLSAIVSVVVSCGTSYLMRPALAANQETRLQRIESRLHRLAKIAGIFFGADE